MNQTARTLGDAKREDDISSLKLEIWMLEIQMKVKKEELEAVTAGRMPDWWYKIKVNSKEVIAKCKELSYLDVLEMAGYPGNLGISVAYHGADGEKTEGCLTYGQTILLKNGTHIDAGRTGSA